MTIAALVGHTGPVALFLGAALEGETFAMLGGMIAHRGLLPLPVAWGAVLLGTLLADQGFFFAGRRLRDRLFVRRIRARAACAKAQAHFDRHPTLFVLLFRFLYGLRAASPVMIGMSGFPPARFAMLNLVAAVVWSLLFVGIGYAFGMGLEQAIGHIADHRDWLPWLLVPVGAGIAFRLVRRRA